MKVKHTMNKAEVVRLFTRDILPVIKRVHEQDGRKRVVARRTAWNDFTDALHKEGVINLRQYENWTHPRCCVK